MIRREFLRIVPPLCGHAAYHSVAHGYSPGNYVPASLVPIYRAINGTPAENLQKIVELYGGVESLVGSDDIVVIKPNMQWWNQGGTNLAAIQALVDVIMNRSGFAGEVVVAENCHRGRLPWESGYSGWQHEFSVNSDVTGIMNMNELAAQLKLRYGDRYTTYHWLDSNVPDAQRVYCCGEGDGYVICDGTGGVELISVGNDADTEWYRETIMSYPVFTTDNGSVVDLCKGEWENGGYTGRPVTFINFSGLNHHGAYCGYTASIKNFLGVVDLSGGADPDVDGILSGHFYNFHSFPFNSNSSGPVPGMLGKEVARFLTAVKHPALHIVSAEWVGLESRTDPPVLHAKTMLASTDPVALDRYAGKYVLYPASLNELHNPGNPDSPAAQYLKACADHGGGLFDETGVTVETYDFDDPPINVVSEYPAIFELGGNFPNPFNGCTTICFSLASDMPVRLCIYSLRGQTIRILADGYYRKGLHTVAWDARDRDGRGVASGVYLYRLQTPHGLTSKHMSLIR